MVCSLLCMYKYEFDLYVFYCIRSSKIAKPIKQKLIFGYIIEELIGDETNSVCTWLVCEYIKDLKYFTWYRWHGYFL